MKKLFTRFIQRNGSEDESKTKTTAKMPSDPKELEVLLQRLGNEFEALMNQFSEDCEGKDEEITSSMVIQQRAIDATEGLILAELSTLANRHKKIIHQHEAAVVSCKSSMQVPQTRKGIVLIPSMTAFINAVDSIQLPNPSTNFRFLYKVKIPEQFHLGGVSIVEQVFVHFDYWVVTRSFQSLQEASTKDIQKIPSSFGSINSGSAWALDVNRETGRIYFSSQSNGRIYGIDPPSEIGAEFTLAQTFNNTQGTNQISAMRTSPDGKYLVAIDFSAHCAHIYDTDTGEVIANRFSNADPATNKSSIVPKTLSYGLGVAFDRAGNFYISDSSNRRIVSSNIDGSVIRELKNPAIGRVQGITIDANGRIWTMVVAGDKLNCFDLEGNLLKTFSVPRVSDVWPNSLALGPDNSILILDWSGNTITQICSETGVVLGSLTVNRPSMCGFGPSGTFYLSGYSDQIKYF